jgi:phosphatidylglycerophosphate synthase
MKQINNPAQQLLYWRFNIPNSVTITRVILAAIVFWLLLQNNPTVTLVAGILLCIGWATDGLDGLLARRMGQSTLAGALFDLVADRLLMTPTLILAIINGLWSGTADYMLFNPYPYAVVVIAADITVLAGVFTFIWKRRTRVIEFPPPTLIARITYSIQMPTLIAVVLGIFPNLLLAILMYLSIIFTLIAFYSYWQKGSYVFTS